MPFFQYNTHFYDKNVAVFYIAGNIGGNYIWWLGPKSLFCKNIGHI